MLATETDATTFTIPEMEGKYKTQGRTTIVNNILMTDYTATGMEFVANCSGDVSVTFNALGFKRTDELGGCYYTIIVDGVKKARDFCHITETGDTTVKIAEGLTEGKHTFEIYRQNEIEVANMGIKSVTLSGELLEAPKNNDMYIEFVGASQWGGYGNLADNSVASSDASAAYYQDGTDALTYLTARELNSDWSIVSVQGIGASWGWQPTSMDTVYKYLRYNKDKTTLYDFARQPDYVVIGLGTNDYNRMAYYNKTTDDLVNSFVDFISLVREKNKNAKIIWVCNMMTADANSYVEQAVATSGGAEKGVYSFSVTKNTDGGAKHPSVAGHRVMAKELSDFISNLESDVILYEDFENVTDISSIIYDVDGSSWTVKAALCTTDAASGTKSASIYGMYQEMFIPISTSLLENGVLYEFSLNWKMSEYTDAKKRTLTAMQFVGWNPSKGENFKDDYVSLSGAFSAINATGEWENTKISFMLYDLSAFEQFGIRLYYSASTPYSQSEDTFYVDNLKLIKAQDPTVKTPLGLTENARTDDTVKVLALGNSFSVDGTAFIEKIAAADGTDLRVGNAWIGGCSLERHYGNIFNGTTDYTLDYHNPNGNQTFKNISLYQALTVTDWDYITIQQVSGKSGQIDTFEPYFASLLSYFKELCPNAKILLHMTWAYSSDSTHSDFSKYESSQVKMYEAIEDTYLQISENYGFLPIIPSGEAIQMVRGTSVGDNLNRDGYHLNDKGRIIAALTWYETITGNCVLNTNFDFANAIGTIGSTNGTVIGITEAEAEIFKSAAHSASELFKKANETQLAIEKIGTVTQNSGKAIENAVALRTELNNDDLLPNIDELLAAVKTYAEITVKAGNINSDNAVNLKDLVVLAQYVAKWNVSVNDRTVDINGDGEVDLSDVTHLAQFLAGWDVAEPVLKPYIDDDFDIDMGED